MNYSLVLRWVCGGLAGLSTVTAWAAPATEGMVRIPAGPFLMGTARDDSRQQVQEYGAIKPWYVDEKPQRKIVLPAFWIDQYEVTNAEYREFVRQANYWVPPSWRDNGYLLNPELLRLADLPSLRRLADDTFRIDANSELMDREALLQAITQVQRKFDPLPVTMVDWGNANDYCHWRGKRLPSEAEWEKAARGDDGREYPWGNQWDSTRLNASGGDRWDSGTAPVGSYPKGVSPYGVFDMAGNVMEWVQDWYGPYPGNQYQTPAYGKKYKVVRGGGWGGMGHYTLAQFYRSAYRLYMQSGSLFVDVGFRCAKDDG